MNNYFDILYTIIVRGSKLKAFFYNEKSLNLTSQYLWLGILPPGFLPSRFLPTDSYPRILALWILTPGFLFPDSYHQIPTPVFLPPGF